MKLLNLNAWGSREIEKVINLIMEENPDFVNMQEVYNLKDGTANDKIKVDNRVLNFTQLIKVKFPYFHFSFSPTLSANKNENFIFYGNQNLSRYPVSDLKTVYYDIEYKHNYTHKKGDNTQEPRNLQSVICFIDNIKVQILNTHGIWQLDRKKTDTDRTINMCEKIIDNINFDLPVILTGDFNLLPETKSIGILREKLRDLVQEAGITNTRSKSQGEVTVVDYVFVNDKIKVNDFRMIETDASDHNAFILDFDII